MLSHTIGWPVTGLLHPPSGLCTPAPLSARRLGPPPFQPGSPGWGCRLCAWSWLPSVKWDRREGAQDPTTCGRQTFLPAPHSSAPSMTLMDPDRYPERRWLWEKPSTHTVLLRLRGDQSANHCGVWPEPLSHLDTQSFLGCRQLVNRVPLKAPCEAGLGTGSATPRSCHQVGLGALQPLEDR